MQYIVFDKKYTVQKFSTSKNNYKIIGRLRFDNPFH